MIRDRRLAKLEGALSPKAATLLWLEEAHWFGSLPAYVDWLIDQPISATPLERVPEQARTAVVQAMSGQPREAVREAARQAVRDAIFLVEIVIRLNTAAAETTRIEGLRYAVFFWEMRALSLEAELRPGGRSLHGDGVLTERWQAWCKNITELVTGLYAAAEARAFLERRYLDGHPALYPDDIADWERLRESAKGLAGRGAAFCTTVEATRVAARDVSVPDLDVLRVAARPQASALAAKLVEEARAAALAVLGDVEGATRIAARPFRGTLAEAQGTTLLAEASAGP